MSRRRNEVLLSAVIVIAVAFFLIRWPACGGGATGGQIAGGDAVASGSIPRRSRADRGRVRGLEEPSAPEVAADRRAGHDAAGRLEQLRQRGSGRRAGGGDRVEADLAAARRDRPGATADEGRNLAFDRALASVLQEMAPLSRQPAPPREGHYVGEFELAVDSCGNKPPFAQREFETAVVDGVLVIQFDTASWSCELIGEGAFECPLLEESKDDESEGRLPHLQRTGRGAWPDDGTIELQLFTQQWCEGTKCVEGPCVWGYMGVGHPRDDEGQPANRDL